MHPDEIEMHHNIEEPNERGLTDNSDLLCCELDAARYRWLRERYGVGDETYLAEGITSESELDEYIDAQLAT